MWNDLAKRAFDGVAGSLTWNPLSFTILAACSAIAWAYTLELNLLVLYTFRRRKGLYFWSLLISSWGCSLHAIGFVLKFMVASPPVSFLIFIEIGWVAMVTGQSFVLFSRLHLVVRNRRTLRLVLCMIVLDGFALHTPTIVFTIGSNSTNADFWVPIFNVMERIQLTLFCVQEAIISTIYILSTVRLLGSIYHSMTRKVMIQLVLINAICIGMDIVLIVLEFMGNYVGETSAKPLIYAIKLRLEFVVLNQLMGLTKAGFTEENNFQGRGANVDPGSGDSNGTSHEMDHGYNKAATLKSEHSASSDPEAATPKKGWAASHMLPGSFSHHRNPLAAPDHIVQTKKVEVLSQPKSPSQEDVTLPNIGHAVSTPPPAATAGKVHHPPMPGKNMAPRGVGTARPAAEGRLSHDSEKDGVQWIDGGR